MKIPENIIINADDFGKDHSVNLAIADAFEKGFINSSSIMANMPAFEEAVGLVYDKKISGNFGVHLVLTDGDSLTEEIMKMPRFFNGNLSFSERLKSLLFLNSHQKNIIFNEFAAQIEKVISHGIKVNHIDTHHQIHDIWPIISIMMSLLKKYNIPYMRILNNIEKSPNTFKNTYRKTIDFYLKKEKINYSDFMGNQIDFISLLNSKTYLLDIESRIEIMVHPDYDNNGNLVDLVNHKQLDINILSALPEH